MGARLRSWWQQIKQHRIAIGVVGIGLVAVIVLIIVGYLFDWTGFNGYNKATIAHIISGTNAGTVTKTEEYQPGKALWDWLQLLIIPAVLAVGGYLFNYTASRNEQKSTQLRDQTERDIAADNQRENALQAYLDKMSELLLANNLRNSGEDEEVQKIARVRTLTVLRRLDAERKGSVLRFLHESGLIDKDKRIIDLSDADLSGADLLRAKLSRANLMGANLIGADLMQAGLSNADLSNADLSDTNLRRAILSGANLMGANLIGADLSDTNLSRAILRGVGLSGANLSGANLSGADLSEANLSRTDLSGARGTTPEQLDKAGPLKDTVMPEGSKHPL